MKASQFYFGSLDHKSRSLSDILHMSDYELEVTHDYIQFLFPLPETSRFNQFAPILTELEIMEFKSSPFLLERVKKSYNRMMQFYFGDSGLTWVTPGNHNFLRISRILRCLNLLGLHFEVTELYKKLEALSLVVDFELPFQFWASAAAF